MMPKTIYITTIILFSAWLLAGCGGDSADDVQRPIEKQNQEISFKADVWKMAEATRATMYDNAAALQTQGSFTCFAYTANSTTLNDDANIKGIPVTWNSTLNQWKFAEIHHWPTSGDLDFFAYVPQTGSLPTYVSVITYAVNGTPAAAPHFTCADLPLSLTPSDATQEFIWALTTGQNKADQGESGVTMTFRHPFARIKFKRSASSSANVTVTSITIPAIYRDGTCTLTGTGGSATSTWSGWDDNDEGLVITGSPATNDDTFYLVIPNNYGSKTLSVAITWKEWDVEDTQTLTAPLDFNWAAGYSYTYSLTITKDDLKVDIEKFTEQW